MQRCAHESSPCPPFCRCLLTTPPSHSLSASDLIGGGKDPCPNIHKWAAVVVDCPSGWGWWFILLLCLGAGGYVGGFALHSHKVKGTPLGREALPHPAFWAEVRSLLEDGIVFAKAKAMAGEAGGTAAAAGDGSAGLLKSGSKAGAESYESAAAASAASPATASAEGTGGGSAAPAQGSESEEDSLVE